MKELPDHLELYKSTPIFTEDTIPKGLLKQHNTKAGTWGKVVILEGEINYNILPPYDETILLSPQKCGIVEPQVYHQLELQGAVKLRVDFYK